MKLAQIQMRVQPDKAENLRHVEALLASVKGADMAVLPEMAAPSRSWTAAGCTTPAMCSVPTGAARPGTGKCTSLTSTWPAASGSGSRTP